MEDQMLNEIYVQYHPLLFKIAYGMIGTVTEAEDIVQELYLQLSEKDLQDVTHQKAYLCKMVTNRCLDYLKSAKKTREVYIGPWLPEPLILQENDPLNQVVRDESMSYAILLLLEHLNPTERAVFILREVFDYDYALIAEIIGKSEANCRKILSRLKGKMPFGHSPQTPGQDKEEMIFSFLSAIKENNLSKLEQLLAHDVTLYADGGGKVSTAIRPVHSRDIVLRFVAHLLELFNQAEYAPMTKIVKINGQTGLIAREQSGIKTALAFHIDKGQIQHIYIVRNPDKLTHVII